MDAATFVPRRMSGWLDGFVCLFVHSLVQEASNRSSDVVDGLFWTFLESSNEISYTKSFYLEFECFPLLKKVNYSVKSSYNQTFYLGLNSFLSYSVKYPYNETFYLGFNSFLSSSPSI
jgi:hypothetical protein